MVVFRKQSSQFLALLSISLITFSNGVVAQSSPNYAITFDVLAQAGSASSSANFVMQDCLGQSSAIGNSASTNYSLSAGYLAASSGWASLTMSLAPGWSWISFNIQPPNLTMEQVFAGLNHLVIVVNGAGQFYIPNVINTIGNLDVTQGYKIYFSTADQLTVHQGTQVPKATPIPLTVGWNFVSYLPTSPMKSETALTAILSELMIAKDDAGNFFIPGVINTLGDMAPQKGYKLYMKNATTLVYP